MIYLIVLFLLIILSLRYDIQGKTKNFVFWYRIVLVVFILIAGLRWRLGVDTPNYLENFYYWHPTLDKFSFSEYGLGKDPFYVLINSIVKTLGGRFYIVQLIQASIVNVLIFVRHITGFKLPLGYIITLYVIGYFDRRNDLIEIPFVIYGYPVARRNDAHDHRKSKRESNQF